MNFLKSVVDASTNLTRNAPPTATTPLQDRVGARVGEVALGTFALPTALSASAAGGMFRALGEDFRILGAATPEERAAAIARRDEHRNQYRKNLRGLGLALTPITFLAPGAIADHFAEPINDGKIHPTGMLYSQKADYRTPSTISEAQEIVEEAKRHNKKISIRGAGYSQGKQTLVSNETDIIIDLKNIKHVAINRERQTVTVGGGALWMDVQKAANENQLAVQVMQASNVFSIGGSISANCHGWDHQQGCIGNTVKSIKIIDSDGKLQMLTPTDELFQYVLGGWGLFGIIVEAEIQLTPNVMLSDTSEMVPIDEYVTYFRNLQRNPSIRMHLYRLSLKPGQLLQEGFAQNYSYDDQAVRSPNLNFEAPSGTPADRILFGVARNSSDARRIYWNTEKKHCCESKTIASRNDFMHPKINATFAIHSKARTEWLQEYFIPPEHLADFIKFLGKILDENEVMLFNASVRYVSHDKISKMGYATTGEKFAVVLFFGQYLSDAEIKKSVKWIQKVIDKVIKYQGTFYLPYGHFARKDQFQQAYGHGLEEVLRMKEMFDKDTRFSNGLYEEYIELRPSNESLSTHVGLPSLQVFQQFTSSFPQNHQMLKDFLDVIFMQVDSKKFLTLFDEAVSNNYTSEQIYDALLEKSSKIRGNIFHKLSDGMKALAQERGTLAANIAKIMDAGAARNGYVEIGMPGRMINPMKALQTIKGKITVVNEEESILQAGIQKPYDSFVKLTYDPLELDQESVDIISCFAGLHHCPEDKLDAFIQSIHRTLREGGLLLLREHDTDSQAMNDLAWMIHSVFNCNTDVSLENEQAEVRNFKSIKEWTELLKRHGFTIVSEPLIREGDTTKNALIKFVKVENPHSDEGQKTILREKLRNEQRNYTREADAAVLNRMEWLNVDVSQALGEDQEFWEHDYFGEVRRNRQVYANAVSTATSRSGILPTIQSEAFANNTTIFLASSIEYLTKGIVYAPIQLGARFVNLFSTENQEDPAWDNVSRQYQEWFQEYGRELEVTPFYGQTYVDKIRNYWQNMGNAWNASRDGGRSAAGLVFNRQSLKNVLTGFVMTGDMLSRAAVASVVNSTQGGVENGDERTIGLIIDGQYQKQENDHVKQVITEDGFNYQAIIAERYKGLENCLKEIARQDLTVVEIAGHTKVQLEMHIEKSNTDYDRLPHFKLDSTSDPNKNFIVLRDIPVQEIKSYILSDDFFRLYDF